MFERFTDRARRILVVAQEQARVLEHNYIGTEHILLAMAWANNDGQPETVAYRALQKHGASHAAIKDGIEQALEGTPTPGATGSPPFTPRAKRVLEYSLREALQLGHNYIGPEHVILGLIREGDGLGIDILKSMNIEPALLRGSVIELIRDEPSPVMPATASTYTLTLSQTQRADLIDWINEFARVLGHRDRLGNDVLPEPLSQLLSRLRRP